MARYLRGGKEGNNKKKAILSSHSSQSNADDCMDAEGRATHGAVAEKRQQRLK